MPSFVSATSLPASTTAVSASTSAIDPPIPAGPSIEPTVGLYSYYGCQTEGTDARALMDYSTAYDTMTLESCATDCTGYTYFGTEYARECYCGDSFSAGSIPAPEADCSFLCAGNPLEYCGAGLRLSVYALTVDKNASVATTPSPGPSIEPTVGPYTYYGCQTEAPNKRTLADKATAYDTMTLESCEADCTGFTFFGTEYARECYCGNSFSPGSVAVANTECNFLCVGNASEYCGAGDRLSVYQVNSGPIGQ